jgi:zinc D-Ala-D-Ala carboxypeptidase
MPHALAPTSRVSSPTRVRRLTGFALGLCVIALLAALGTVAVQATLASVDDPFTPTIDDGLIPEGMIVTLADDEVPAVARLDPALRDALRQAETDAAADGLAFQFTSGWRSPQYQQWLLEDAVELYGSDEVARQFVATPDRSSHVTGRAVDIVPVDAQFWLIENGARYGICQTYANERWHFELATEPGGVCPAMKADAAS